MQQQTQEARAEPRAWTIVALIVAAVIALKVGSSLWIGLSLAVTGPLALDAAIAASERARSRCGDRSKA